MSKPTVSDRLKAVLCDPDGNVCINGSNADLAEIKDCLRKIERMEEWISYALVKLKRENGTAVKMNKTLMSFQNLIDFHKKEIENHAD